VANALAGPIRGGTTSQQGRALTTRQLWPGDSATAVLPGDSATAVLPGDSATAARLR